MTEMSSIDWKISNKPNSHLKRNLQREVAGESDSSTGDGHHLWTVWAAAPGRSEATEEPSAQVPVADRDLFQRDSAIFN